MSIIWYGAVQQVMMTRNHPGKSDIFFLLMMELFVSDENCMYSTLCLIASQGERNGFSTVVTFDQQLWWKAMLAIENDILECRVKQDV